MGPSSEEGCVLGAVDCDRRMLVLGVYRRREDILTPLAVWHEIMVLLIVNVKHSSPYGLTRALIINDKC